MELEPPQSSLMAQHYADNLSEWRPMMLERTNGTGGLRDARIDESQAVLIEAAIAILESRGKPEAAAFLDAHGVSFGVTVRVLNEVHARRPSSA